MKKDKLGFYVFTTLLLIAIAIFKNDYLSIIFWLGMTTFLILKLGIPRDKNYHKVNTIRIIIISLLSYFVISYSLGIITGFSKNIYSLKLIRIITNILPTLVMITCEEIIRYIYAKNSQYNNKKYIYLTIIFIVLDIAMGFNSRYLGNAELIFIFICSIVLPSICSELTYSYISYEVSYVPVLIMRYVLELSIYVLPIIPNLGAYLDSVLGIIYPVFIYLTVSKSIKEYDKFNKYISNTRKSYLLYPILIISFIIVFLVSGLGKYKMIAIGSGSMEPIYYRGDAIIYKKITDCSQIEIGNILAYQVDKTLVTHRVVGIDKKKGKYIFLTKGDNNDNVDSYEIKEDNVRGIVVYRIAYLGLPSIWMQELFNNL